MKKIFLLAGISLALTGTALAGSKNDQNYDMFVIADEAADSAVYVITHGRDTVAIEVFDDENARWIKDSKGKRAIKDAERFYGRKGEEKGKGFAFAVKDEDVHISFPFFFRHISIDASDADGARVNITSKDGEGDVFVRANDAGAFITIEDASAKTARKFIDDIDEAPRLMRKKMKRELGLQ
jgi:hypothetical protein